MKLLISPDIIKSFPNLRIGIAIATDLKIKERDTELQNLKLETERKIRKTMFLEMVNQHPHIVAWRDAYKSFGASPKKHPPTVEALLKRVLEGYPIPAINTLVDSYLIVELEHIVPVGGYDLDKIVSDIHLRYAKSGELFTPLGSPDRKEQTLSGEVIYSDSEKILTRRWNYRDCDEAKITLQTKGVALFIEAPDNRIPTVILEKASERLSQLIKRFNEGEVKWFILDASKNLSLDLIF